MILDATAFTGSWPYHKVKGGLTSLLRTHRQNGIGGGVLSSLEAVFYNDPFMADAALAKRLPKGYRLGVSHNPLLPMAAEQVAANPLGAVSLRLYPCIHGYQLPQPEAGNLCAAAAQAGLVICVVARLEDERLEYLLHQRVPPLSEMIALAHSLPGARFIAAGYTAAELLAAAPALAACPNVYVDTARCGNLVFPFEQLSTAIPVSRLLFATHSPLLCVQSNTFAAAGAGEAILYSNTAALLMEKQKPLL